MKALCPTLLLLSLLSLLACASCQRPPAEEPLDHDDTKDGHAAHGEGSAEGHGEAEHAEAGHDDEASIDLAGVRGVSFLEVGALRQEAAYFAAEAIADEQAEALLSAPLGGTLTRVAVAPGQEVRAGAHLFTLQSPELAQLRGDLLRAQARSARAQAELAREERLAAVAATAARDVEAAKADAMVAAADEQAARLSLASRGLPPGADGSEVVVRAPRAGVVAVLAVRPFQRVEAGDELARLAPTTAALVRVELPLPGAAAWTPGVETEVRRADGQQWTAVVENVPTALSADSRRLVYRLRLRGDGLPLAGTPLEAKVPLATAIVLPQAALQQIEGTWNVFVRSLHEGKAHAELRPIRRGADLGGDVMVLDGLEPGEWVAADGAYLLKALWLKRLGGGDAHAH
jgi:cobalt-zinc-cadmium efflux system membrane fusion protein